MWVPPYPTTHCSPTLCTNFGASVHSYGLAVYKYHPLRQMSTDTSLKSRDSATAALTERSVEVTGEELEGVVCQHSIVLRLFPLGCWYGNVFQGPVLSPRGVAVVQTSNPDL